MSKGKQEETKKQEPVFCEECRNMQPGNTVQNARCRLVRDTFIRRTGVEGNPLEFKLCTLVNVDGTCDKFEAK